MDIQKKKSKSKTVSTKVTELKKVSDLSCATRITASIIGVTWVFVLLVASVSLIYSVVYADVAFPGAQLSKEDVSNLSYKDLKALSEKRIAEVQEEKWQLTYGDKKAEVTTDELGLTFSAQETADQIWHFGRTENFFVNIKDQMLGLFAGANFAPHSTVTLKTADEFVDTKLAEFQVAPKNATLTVNSNGAIGIIGSDPGRMIDTTLFVVDVLKNIELGQTKTTKLASYATTADVTSNIARESRQDIAKLLSSDVSLKYQDENWTISKAEIGTWITATPSEIRTSNTRDLPASTDVVITLHDDDVEFSFAEKAQNDLIPTQTAEDIQSLVEKVDELDTPLGIRERVARGLGQKNNIEASQPTILAITIDKQKLNKTFDPITEDIDIDGKNAVLAYENGAIVVKQKSEKGRGVDREDALDKILTAVNSNRTRDIQLVVNEIPAKVTEDNFAKMGIRELLATGESNFVGSPRNRVHNIRTAAANFEGALIAPGDEYSFVTDLGEVDASTGYLPELVIKGNKITPEYGGGVCQVSSTMFRAAVYAGLEITERRNHSFVVSYYGTPGMDATIYIPHPDLRFVNDTPGYILMQPRIDGTKLYFDFFGTSDGRTTETQGPYIYARQASGALKATWTQIVTKDGEVFREKVFNSSYKPASSFTRTN